MSSNLLLIDSNVKENQLLLTSANENSFPIVYSSSSTRMEILELIKANFSAIERIGLVFHGGLSHNSPFLENQPFFSENEESFNPHSENVEFLLMIIKDFNVKNIDFLACDTLSYPSWLSYYSILEKTGVVVGASNNKTGNIKYGGDWIMESTSEDIECIYFTENIKNYAELLSFADGFILTIKRDGTIWGTGRNLSGQLGTGNNTSVNVLTQMINTTGKIPKSIFAGNNYSIVLMTDGTIWGTGQNNSGQLGTGNNTNVNVLTQMINTTGKIPKSISAGNNFSIVLMTDGTIWGTGQNYDGQLGAGNNTNVNVLTQMINNTDKIPKIICGSVDFSIVLMTDGTIWGTGQNYYGVLGTENNTSVNVLTQMVNNTGKIPKSISAGFYHSVVLMTDGTIWATGDNGNKQLGTGNNTNVNVLTQMVNNTGKIPQSIYGCSTVSIVVMTDRTIWSVGRNFSGELGIGNNNTNVAVLTQMINNTGKIPKSISGSQCQNYVLMTDGTIWGTGDNFNGQLGTGNNTRVNVLTQMVNGIDIEYVMDSISTEPEPTEPEPISNICFLAGTPITTDQGIIAIEKINPKIHTIRKNEIVAITKTVTQDKYLVCFDKDSLGNNIPNQKTVISRNHKLFYKGNMMRAKEFVNDFENVRQVKYSGEILYNVLLKEHDKMMVNNLICETLHPENSVAKLYKVLETLTPEKQNKLIEKVNEYVIKNKCYSSSKNK